MSPKSSTDPESTPSAWDKYKDLPMPPSAPTYPNSIPSVWDKHKSLPKEHGFVNLDQKINAGDQITNRDLDLARSLVKYLEAVHELEADPTITKDVISNAKIRARLIEGHVNEAYYHNAMFGEGASKEKEKPTGVVNAFEMDGSDTPLGLRPLVSAPTARSQEDQAIDAAKQANYAIRWENTLGSTKNGWRPIQKTVPGNGQLLAEKLVPAFGPATNFRHNALLHWEQVDNTKAYKDAKIGQTPPQFFGEITKAWDIDYVLVMVYFYNMDFGIDPKKDDHPTWILKARSAFVLDTPPDVLQR